MFALFLYFIKVEYVELGYQVYDWQLKTQDSPKIEY